MDLTALGDAGYGTSLSAPAPGAPGQDLDLVDLRVPCNPYFPTPEMFGLLGRALEPILKHPPSDADTVTGELSGALGLNPQTVTMGNGTAELTTWIDQLLIHESLAVPIPTSGRWTGRPLETGKRVD